MCHESYYYHTTYDGQGARSRKVGFRVVNRVSLIFKGPTPSVIKKSKKIFCFDFSKNIHNFFVFQYFFIKISVRSELVVKRSNPGIFQHSIKYFG